MAQNSSLGQFTHLKGWGGGRWGLAKEEETGVFEGGPQCTLCLYSFFVFIYLCIIFS